MAAAAVAASAGGGGDRRFRGWRRLRRHQRPEPFGGEAAAATLPAGYVVGGGGGSIGSRRRPPPPPYGRGAPGHSCEGAQISRPTLGKQSHRNIGTFQKTDYSLPPFRSPTEGEIILHTGEKFKVRNIPKCCSARDWRLEHFLRAHVTTRPTINMGTKHVPLNIIHGSVAYPDVRSATKPLRGFRQALGTCPSPASPSVCRHQRAD